jgi:integrase
MRNPNGFGSVYKLPGNRRRPWVARVTTGWKTTIAKRGKHKGEEVVRQTYQILGYFEEKPDAIVALANHRVAPVSSRANITLGELYQEWSEAKYDKLTKSTADNYRAAWIYLSQHENVKMKEYRTAHIQRVLDKARKEGKSQSTLQKIRSVAVMLCNHAMKNDIVHKNYAKLVELPKMEKKKKGRFSDLEVKKLWKNVDVPWVDTILILIYTGMRITELLTLTRFSIDWDKNIITGGIKTDAGKDRVIPIHPKIIPLIKKYYDQSGETLISKDGKMMSRDYYRKFIYYRTLEKVGLPKLSPHVCRHTFASMMADAGVDPASIQAIIGHSDYNTTANIYTHKDIGKLAEAMQKLG